MVEDKKGNRGKSFWQMFVITVRYCMEWGHCLGLAFTFKYLVGAEVSLPCLQDQHLADTFPQSLAMWRKCLSFPSYALFSNRNVRKPDLNEDDQRISILIIRVIAIPGRGPGRFLK